MKTSSAAVVCLCLWPALAAQPPQAPVEPASAGPAAPAQEGVAPAAQPAPAPKSLEEALEALDQGMAAAPGEATYQSLLEFHKAEEEQTYVSVSIGYRPEEVRKATGSPATPQPFVRLRGLAEEALRYDFTQPSDFADSGTANASGLKVLQTGSAVAPGPYRVSLGVWVPGAGLAGGRSEEVVVPNFSSSSLELSSLTLASVVEKISGVDGRLKHPFVWGSFRVVPRLTPVLPRQEPLRLYYQIYNATPDPASGRPRLDITYRFYQKKNGRFLPQGQQPIRNQDSQVAIYELPVDRWPAGEFKVQVQVRDSVSNATATRELAFELR